MIKARQGLLERQSLEDSCFVADGEDTSGCEFYSCFAVVSADEYVVCMPVFTHPLPAQSRSSTCTLSSGAGTPPLSSFDGSSISGGSQSSIDLSQLNMALDAILNPTYLGPRFMKLLRRRPDQVPPSQLLQGRKDDTTRRQPISEVDSDTL